MVAIKTVADGLGKQIEAAIAGKADAVQADILCKSVDVLIRLAKLQVELGQIDWSTSDELPVVEMESVKKIAPAHLEVKPETINQNVPDPIKINLLAKTARGQDVERSVLSLREKLAKANDKQAAALTDQIAMQMNKLRRIEPDYCA